MARVTPAAPSLPDDRLTWLLAQGLRTCLCAELADAPVACCCLLPGAQAALDDCGRGQAWVRVQSIYATDVFPNPAGGAASACGGNYGWAVVFELGIARCAPVPDAQGNLPACDTYSDVTRRILADAAAMRQAVLCCDWHTASGNTGKVITGPWQPFGPEGACVGGVMTVTVQVEDCVCDPPPDTPTPTSTAARYGEL